jgi:hypothetical protein
MKRHVPRPPAAQQQHLKVVQIFDPVLVKTDCASFSALVQKLTGKSDACSRYWSKLRELNICSDGAMVEVRGDEMMGILDSLVASVAGLDELDDPLLALVADDFSPTKNRISSVIDDNSSSGFIEASSSYDNEGNRVVFASDLDMSAELAAEPNDLSTLPPWILPHHFALHP